MAGRPATRSLPEVAAAAWRVFTAKGYRSTGISDVAKELGLSHGALYTYVRSKEALLYLALAHSIRPDLLDRMALPVELPVAAEVVGLARQWLDRNGFPRLTAAVDRPAGGPARAEVGGGVGGAYG